MPRRATIWGEQRTPLQADCEVLICGSSFAGLAVARALAGSGAKVLVVDRYALGDRQTSACATPTAWLKALSLEETILDTFWELVAHTPTGTTHWPLPFSFSTFDYPALCQGLWEQAGLPDDAYQIATVKGFADGAVQTDRGELRAALVVDALGWRRVLGEGEPIQPPNAFLSRGLEVEAPGEGRGMELWLDPSYVRAGYSWSFPAAGKLRVGCGSFWPRHHVRQPTERLAAQLGLPADRFHGNWIPHRIRPAVEGQRFFVGDAAGHCLPVTAEGIRTAFYFGLYLGLQLREVLSGRKDRAAALAAYASFHQRHAWIYNRLLAVQRAVGYLMPTAAVRGLVRALGNRQLSLWAFRHYYRIAPPPAQPLGPGAQVAAIVGALGR